MKTFRSVIADALVEARDEGVIRQDQGLAELGARLAVILSRRLRQEGYGIHDAAKCVRPVHEELGRPMTADEAKAFGITLPIEQA